MATILARHSVDRRRIVSYWFRRRMMSLGIFTGLVVFGAVCVSFGAVGIGIGAGILFGVAALVFYERRKRLNEFIRRPDRSDEFLR
jgi:hypothetical protein